MSQTPTFGGRQFSHRESDILLSEALVGGRYRKDTSPSELRSMRRNFEAGGTILWGAEYDCDSVSEMTGLAPIKENDEGSAAADVVSDRGSHIDATSYTDSIAASTETPMRRRPSELRTNLLRHKQLWQKAAKQAKQGGSIEHRRRSILPIEDIGLTDPSWKTSTRFSVDDDDEETSVSADMPVDGATDNIPQTSSTDNPLQVPHTKVMPLSSLDIERDIKPQLRPARKILGFIFPRIPTQFKLDLNESLYQRYYSHKRKKTMLMINILYSILLVGLYILKILPISAESARLDISYILRETIITVIMLAIHIAISIYIKKVNSHNEVLVCAYTTWGLLFIHTQIAPWTSFMDYQSLSDKELTWYSFGTWQTALAVSVPFGFLPVIPLRRMIALSVVLSALHLISAGIITGYYNVSCLPKLLVDALIMIALVVKGMLNYYLVERTERKAFLEIRTCISSRHTIAKENQSQEKLVVSVLPKFIVNDILKEECHNGPFYNIYLERYTNVSILFADICGFTTLGTKLTAKDLVNMLNDLFANFDKLAKKHKCLRIKLLGDCYESVCGIPDHTPDHADNCVEMGLDMIGAIRLVREQQNVEVLDMRIGVHTGSVFGGVLGLRKWQFDVYSDDVSTANVMESSGEKGRVHISEATRVCLTRSYDIEPNDNLQNAYLKELGMSTFFIKPKEPANIAQVPNLKKRVSYFERRPTMHSIDGECLACDQETKLPIPLRHSTDNAVNHMLQRATDSKADDRLAKEFVHKVHLIYKDKEYEMKYRDSKDDSFQTNALSFVIMALVIVITQIVSSVSQPAPTSWVGPVLTGIVFLLSASSLIWLIMFRLMAYYKYQKLIKESMSDWKSNISAASHLKELKDASLPRSLAIRNTVITLVMVSLFLSTIFQPIYMKTMGMETKDICYDSYIWLAWMLVILSTASFLKWSYILKVPIIALISVAFIIVQEYAATKSISTVYQELQFDPSASKNITVTEIILYGHLKLYARVEYIIVILFSAVILIFYSRVLELHARLDFLWRLQAKHELQEMDQVRENNLTLLRNILPEHVANIFLARNRRDEELYCESYNNVAVMFASICNFNEFWLAVQANGHGYGCLMILNEIIADFDELLVQPAFVEVEKIKTIGSTYMTCVGLSPVQKSENNVSQNLRTCADLAFEMQKALNGINQNAFNNNFQIRIGINHGPVVAGVIGARKPHYDIWGHTVNIASRMESNCQPGEVMVMEKTANIYQKLNYPTAYKDIIAVKGLAEPQKVCTVNEPERTQHPLSMRRAALGSTAMNSFDNVVLKILKSPSTRQKVKKTAGAANDLE